MNPIATTCRSPIAEGEVIRGGLNILRGYMKRAGFAQVGGIYSARFTDGTATFRGVPGSYCNMQGHTADLWTLRQVWGAE